MRSTLLILTTLLLLVSLAPLAQSARPKKDDDDGKNRKVTIQNLAYSPAKVTIKKGEKVTWTNKDNQDHTVNESAGVFTSGNIKPGKSYSYTFDKAGTYSYRCKHHPRMKGTVEVK
jgi:plastocyanin